MDDILCNVSQLKFVINEKLCKLQNSVKDYEEEVTSVKEDVERQIDNLKSTCNATLGKKLMEHESLVNDRIDNRFQEIPNMVDEKITTAKTACTCPPQCATPISPSPRLCFLLHRK